MDASTLKVADTAAIHVKDSAGEPLYDGDKPVRIVLHGPGTRAYAAMDSRQTARQLKRYNDNEGKITAPTTEERRRETAEDLATVTISFENLTYGDKVGPELFQAVYSDPALGFIVPQVQKALKDWSVFQGKSATS